MKARKVQNAIAALIAILAVLGLIFQTDLEELWHDVEMRNDPRPIIARISNIQGKAHFRTSDSINLRKAHHRLRLRAHDTLSVDDNSEVTIELSKTGSKMKLLAGTLVVFEDSTSGATSDMIFLRGSAVELNEKPAVNGGAAEITKELADHPQNAISGTESPESAPVHDSTPISEKDVKDKGGAGGEKTLPDSYITNIIRNQRPFLARCYAQALRLNPDARGRIDTSLNIEPSGVVSTARVIGSTIPDPTLQQCVVSTLQRIKFKSFEGSPIVVNYPVNLQ